MQHPNSTCPGGWVSPEDLIFGFNEAERKEYRMGKILGWNPNSRPVALRGMVSLRPRLSPVKYQYLLAEDQRKQQMLRAGLQGCRVWADGQLLWLFFPFELQSRWSPGSSEKRQPSPAQPKRNSNSQARLLSSSLKASQDCPCWLPCAVVVAREPLTIFMCSHMTGLRKGSDMVGPGGIPEAAMPSGCCWRPWPLVPRDGSCGEAPG